MTDHVAITDEQYATMADLAEDVLTTAPGTPARDEAVTCLLAYQARIDWPHKATAEQVHRWHDRFACVIEGITGQPVPVLEGGA